MSKRYENEMAERVRGEVGGTEGGGKRVKNLRDFYWPRENVCRRDKDVRLSRFFSD